MNKQLDNISTSLGIAKRKRTIFELEPVNESEMKLTIKNGKPDINSVWFGTNSKSPCALVPAGLLEAIINALKSAQRENFELRLERAIWRNIPVDFGDVWSVVMDEIGKSKFKKEPDIDKLLRKIKKEHPNLFVDVHGLLQNKVD